MSVRLRLSRHRKRFRVQRLTYHPNNFVGLKSHTWQDFDEEWQARAWLEDQHAELKERNVHVITEIDL